MTYNDMTSHLLTFSLAGQIFGIPVLQVNDVLGPQKITHTPLAAPAIRGIMNLRGRIVTAIEARQSLGQPPREDSHHSMNVVIDNNGELFSLIVDEVGDVMSLDQSSYEDVPPTFDPQWARIASGIHKLEDQILVVVDVKKFLAISGYTEGDLL